MPRRPPRAPRGPAGRRLARAAARPPASAPRPRPPPKPAGEGAGRTVALELPGPYGPAFPPRPVRVWLPPTYDGCTPHAVLYAHDGQNLLDRTRAWRGRSWQLGVTLSRLAAEGRTRSAVCVAVDNADGPLRVQELGDSPVGDSFRRWLEREVKPRVDERFATLPGPASCSVLGSSMGGTSAFLSVYRSPDVFGAAACLSPVFQPPLCAEVAAGPRWDEPPLARARLFVDNGGDDLERLVWVDDGGAWPVPGDDRFWLAHFDTALQPGVDSMLSSLRGAGLGGGRLAYHRAAGAPHTEAAWGERVWRPLEFLLGASSYSGSA